MDVRRLAGLSFMGIAIFCAVLVGSLLMRAEPPAARANSGVQHTYFPLTARQILAMSPIERRVHRYGVQTYFGEVSNFSAYDAYTATITALFSDTVQLKLVKDTYLTDFPVISPQAGAPFGIWVPTEYVLLSAEITSQKVYTRGDIVYLDVISAEWDQCYDLIGSSVVGEVRNSTAHQVEITGIGFWRLDVLHPEYASAYPAQSVLRPGETTSYASSPLFGGCPFGDDLPIDPFDYDPVAQGRILP
jgi:hypothetical protein